MASETNDLSSGTSVVIAELITVLCIFKMLFINTTIFGIFDFRSRIKDFHNNQNGSVMKKVIFLSISCLLTFS